MNPDPLDGVDAPSRATPATRRSGSALSAGARTGKAFKRTWAFHLVLAITAARDNDRPQAHEHLDQAWKIADRMIGLAAR